MKRLFSKDGGGDHTDKISSLPDTVLGHILSFLATEKAITTSILSKRWHYVWTYRTNLDFDDLNSYRKHVEVAGKMQFPQYVHGVLHLLRAPRINTFSLQSFRVGFVEYDITSWLQVVIARNVELIDVHCYKMYYNLPMCLYNCNSLVKLKLHYATIKYIPDAQFFASLKELYLNETKFHNDECLKKLIFGCSALEDLSLYSCSYLHLSSGILYISSLTLKTLRISGTWGPSSKVKYVFNAPALENLRIDEGESRELIAQDLSSISEVYISICTRSMSKGDTCRKSFIKFIESLYNVNSLCFRVAFATPYAISVTLESLFHNLTELDIGSTTLDLGLLNRFLENANNLQSLSLAKVAELDGQVRWINPPHVPSCLSSCLKKVSVDGYEANDLAMIEYFLKNGEVLEIVKLTPLYSYDNYKSKFNLLRKISLLPRGSEICRIEFSKSTFDYPIVGA